MSKNPSVEDQAKELAQSCLAVRVRLLSRVVTRLYESHLRDSELTVGQLNMLAATLNLGPQHATAVRLGEILHMEKSTVSRNLDKMEDRGWIRRQLPKQGRLEAITATRAGRRAFSQAYPGWCAAQQEAADRLGEELRTALDHGFAPRTIPTIPQ